MDLGNLVEIVVHYLLIGLITFDFFDILDLLINCHASLNLVSRDF